MKKFSSTMKANSRHTLRNRKRIRVLLSTAFITLLLIFVLPVLGRSVVALVVEPVVVVKSWMQTSQHMIPVFFRDRLVLENQIQALEQEIAQLQASPAAAAYRTALAMYGGATSTDRIVAGVLLDPSLTPFETLVIDKGSADGVVVDAPVFVAAEHVIGLVSAVSTNQSTVQLLSTAGMESTVYIFGPDIYTTARGLGGGVLQVGVPQGITLTPGDIVVTPSLNGGLVGQISYVDSTPSQPEQYGFVSGPVAINQLYKVAVGTTALAPQTFAAAQAEIAAQRERITKVPVPDGVLIDIAVAALATSSTSTADGTEIEFE